MKFSFGLPNMIKIPAMTQPWELQVSGPDQLSIARRAESMGYDMISVSEHFLVPLSHVDRSGPHYFHGIAGMAAIAGATERIRINSCVLILPLQHPVVTAKGLSTTDWMSGGRTTVTFGVGWDKEEFEILGVPFAERGRMADEYLAAMIELWTKEKPEFEGKYVSFKDVAFEPKPVQKPHLPVWIGGEADAALKRAARFATGWWPFQCAPDRIGERIDFIKSQPDFRASGEFEVMFGLGTGLLTEDHRIKDANFQHGGLSTQAVIDRIGALKQQGVTMTSVPAPAVSGLEACMDHAQWVMEEIKPKV